MDRKLIVLMLLLSGATVDSAEITNVTQCLNVELGQIVLNSINPTNCATHQVAYLGFVRGLISGDYRSYLLHLKDSLRIEECGTADIQAITPKMTNDFLVFTQSMGYTNHLIKTYCESLTGTVWHVSSKLQSQKGTRIDLSQMDIEFENVNGEWRVSRWDVDE